jgi:hypothetical protein
MRERKLRSVVNWQGALKQKGAKQGWHIYTLSPRVQYTYTAASVLLLVILRLRSNNACRRNVHQLGDVLIAYFIRRHVPACVAYCVCLAVAVHKPLLKPCKCALAVCCTGTVRLRSLCSQVPPLSLFAVGIAPNYQLQYILCSRKESQGCLCPHCHPVPWTLHTGTLSSRHCQTLAQKCPLVMRKFRPMYSCDGYWKLQLKSISLQFVRSFMHSAVRLTCPQPLPKPILHRVRSSASSFKFQHLLFP